MLSRMLVSLGHTGWSAEIGVWGGEHSMSIMQKWPQGGQHFLVDPYRHYNTSCPTTLKHYDASGRLRRGRTSIMRLVGDKQCSVKQQRFDNVYTKTSKLVHRRFGERAVFLRNMSVDGARQLPMSSLDFIYIDARHDYAGVLEDMRAWWPKLCAGGLFAGHDYEGEVPSAVHDFVRTDLRSSSPLYVTADHPASWFILRMPQPCK